jgi:uncharacterized protein (TIGR02301 family)
MAQLAYLIKTGLLVLAMSVVALQFSAAAMAQETTAPATGAENAPADAANPDTPDTSPGPKTLPPAYENQMLQLAEVLGSLHYLRELCGADEGQTWRDQMTSLLEAEEPSDDRRAQLIAHFNRGFRGYQEIYRECTKPAAEAANQFLNQGMRLAAEIPNRFGR